MAHTTLSINIRPAHENRTFHTGNYKTENGKCVTSKGGAEEGRGGIGRYGEVERVERHGSKNFKYFSIFLQTLAMSLFIVFSLICSCCWLKL